MPKQFHGDGFKETPIEGQEAARHRHLYTKLDDSFIPMTDDQYKAMVKGPERGTKDDALWKYLGPIIQVLQNWKMIAGAIAIALFIGGAPLVDRISEMLAGFLK